MSMTSEVQNLLTGRVEATPLYLSAKKVVGMPSANIIPNAQGVAPLSKQSAFVQVVQEQPQTLNEIQEEVFAPVNPVDEFNPTAVENTFVSPEYTSPVSTSDPSTLGTINTSDIAVPVFETVKEETPTEDVNNFFDTEFQLPQMPEVAALEPTAADNNLFASQAQDLPMDTTPINEPLPASVPTESQFAPLSVVTPIEQSNDYIEAAINEKERIIKAFVEEQFKELREQINKQNVSEAPKEAEDDLGGFSLAA